MYKLFSLKTMSAIALSLSMTLGALVASPAVSAFAKIKTDTTPAEERRDAYRDKSDSFTTVSSGLLYTAPQFTYNRRADGKYTVHPR